MFRRIILFIFLASSIALHAQSFLQRSTLGIAAGGMNYMGDLNKQSMLGKVNFGGGILFRYDFNNRWAVMVSANYGRVGGDKDVEHRRNLSFRSNIYEGSFRVEFNFVPFGKSGAQYRTTPFLFCGLGLFHFNPMTRYTDTLSHETQWVELQPLGTEGQGTSAFPDKTKYSLTQLMLPFGLGFKALIGNNIILTIEYGFRKTWTDYIDDISTIYVGSAVLDNGTETGKLAAALADRSYEVEPGYVNAPGIKRGDDSLNDWYSFFNFSVNIRMEALFGWMRGKQCETGK